MNNMKKIVILLCTVPLLISGFGCTKKTENVPEAIVENNTDNQETVLDDDYYFSDLSSERYDGYNYRILVRKDNSGTQYFDEPQEDIVSNAIYERNKAVEERYGITISISETSNADYEAEALNTILAGDDAYDIIYPHSRAAFIYAVQGACANLNEIESIHLDKPWWAKDIIESCTINGNLYVLDGDISAVGLSNTACLYFNKRIFDELGYDYPYEAVRNGEWTFDEFSYLVRKGSADLNGDGLITVENDRYGFSTGKWGAPMIMPYTGGQRIYSTDDAGNLYISLYTSKTVDIYTDFFGMMSGEAATYDGSSSMFTEGRLMFISSGLGSAQSYRNMDDEFGIVPYPKYDSTDSYATISDGGSPLLIIPITVKDYERTGAITEALCAYGSKLVIPSFYEKALKTKYARDDDSEEMIDIIKNSRVFDLGYLSGGELQSTGYELSNTLGSDFSSFYAERKDAAQISLENFVKDYGA